MRITASLIALPISVFAVLLPLQAQETREGATEEEVPLLFFTADRCIACHSDLSTTAGEDVSIGYHWRPSMMANSARDPYWQAAVRREVTDHPEARAAIEDKCATCHMPMARFRAKAAGEPGVVFRHIRPPAGNGAAWRGILARDGASCTVCHQIRAENLGDSESFTGGFLIDTTRAPGDRQLFGPFEVDSGRTAIMRSASRFVPTERTHIQESELCATCHTLYTHALDEDGAVVGELPEQVPYLEWAHSEYRYSRSCQSCHMPELQEEVPISSVLGPARSGLSRHVFRGANAFMLRILNKYRAEQDVTAPPQEVDAALARTVRFLETSAARVSLESVRSAGSSLLADVSIENLAGHKLPTAYPSRRVWLHIIVRDGTGDIIFQSGTLRPDGSIIGNENDADATRYEPHYTQIERSDQVQIYEPIMVDSEGHVTTGLLFGVRYVKDNRLLPRGFEASTADDDIAVQGRAVDDPDFLGGGDRVRYRVDLGTARGPFTVTAELWYQSIGYRWAHNLKAHAAPETDRFVNYYEATAGRSAVRIAGDTSELQNPDGTHP